MSEYLNEDKQPIEDKTQRELMIGILKKTTGIYNILLFCLWVAIFVCFMWIVLYFALSK